MRECDAVALTEPVPKPELDPKQEYNTIALNVCEIVREAVALLLGVHKTELFSVVVTEPVQSR